MLKILAVAAAILALLGSSALAADDPTSCVQTYLSRAGYAIGAVDGKLGKGTIAIGGVFAAAYPELKLPKLSKSTVSKWCEFAEGETGQAILAARPIPPITAPAETVGANGGLNFDHPLVRANYVGTDRVLHGSLASFWPGRVAVDTDPSRVRPGSAGSIRMHMLPGDCAGSAVDGPTGWNDCKAENERVETTGDPTDDGEWYYGLSIMLDKNMFDLKPYGNKWVAAEVNLFQWYQFDSGACFNIQYTADQKSLDIDTRCWSGEYKPTYREVLLEQIEPDRWYEFVVHANWAADDTGFFRVLQNGKMVMAYTGPTIVRKGRPLINDHPQVYAYGGSPDDVPAWVHYRTPMTVWFSDMIRSRDLSDVHERYQFEDASLTDFDSALPVTDFDPGLIGDLELFAEGEADQLPPGAIGPGATLPADVVSGFKDAVRARLTNAKAYGLARVADPAGGPKPALRFEVRPGDCGKESTGDWDNCEHGQESVISATATTMKAGEKYSLSWRAYVEAPTRPLGNGNVVLMQLGQPVADDSLFFSWQGLKIQHANEPPKSLLPTNKVYGVWHDYVLDVVWSRGKSGRMKLTMDGTEVYSYEGPTLPEGEARATFGIRRDAFKDVTSVAYFQDVVLEKRK